MTAKKLTLLNLGWAALAVGTYFMGTSDRGKDAATEATNRSVASSVRSLSVLRDERTPDSKNGGRSNGSQDRAAGLTQALRDAGTARARAEEQLADFARTVTPETALSMLEVFKETPRDAMTDRVFLDFLQAWGKVAGPEAVSVAMDSFGAESGSRWGDRASLESVIAGWTSEDPAAAMEFAASVRDKPRGDLLAPAKSLRMHLGILQSLQDSNLDEAIAYSQQFYADTSKSLRESPSGSLGLESVLAAVAEQRGLVGVEAWVAGIDGDNPNLRAYKRKATAQMLEAMRAEDPARAAGWVAANSDQGFVPSRSVRDAADTISDNPEAQLDWITELPEMPDRTVRDAVWSVFSSFLRRDFDAAGDWLAGQSLGPRFDSAIATYAREATASNPQAARLWANEIDDERLRASILREIDETQ